MTGNIFKKVVRIEKKLFNGKYMSRPVVKRFKDQNRKTAFIVMFKEFIIQYNTKHPSQWYQA